MWYKYRGQIMRKLLYNESQSFIKFRKIISYDTFIFLSIWILLIIAGREKLFRDPGTFSHIAIGNIILGTGNLIYKDSFSFTRFGEHWIAQQWLGELIMAIIHRVAGLDGLLIVTTCLIALLYASLALRIDRSGMNLVLGSLLMALSLAAASHHLHVRPHIVTFLLIGILYSKLCDIETEKASYKSLFWFIPIFIIWTNIHGGVLGGLFTLLITTAGWTLACLLGWRSPICNQNRLVSIWVFSLLCCATILVNPYGLDLPATWLNIMRSKAIAELIQEHASVFALLQRGDVSSLITMAVVLCLALFYFAILAGTNRNERRVTWYIPIIWFFLSLSRIRHAPLFAVITVVAITEIFPHCHWVHSLGNRGLITFKMRKTFEKTGMPYFVPAIIVGIAMLAFLSSANLPSTAQKLVRFDASHWPHEILPELQAVEISHSNGSPIFNDMLFGAFLIYYTPGLRVFIDDRCELYGDEFIRKYVEANRSDFSAWKATYKYDLALIYPYSNYKSYFDDDPDWCVVKRCHSAVLYQKCNTINLGKNR
jgi:hypothetical protein